MMAVPAGSLPPARAGQPVPEAAGRVASLDGLRGVAALSVVALHLLSLLLATSLPALQPFDKGFAWLSLTPARLLWSGSSAVILFFALSGYALHRMLQAGHMSTTSYLVRRVVRLWLPYAFSIGLAAFLVATIGTRKIPGQSNWLNGLLGTYPSTPTVVAHLLMVGVFDTKALNFVVWSLVIEMRMSLVFPWLHRWITRFGIVPTAIACVAVVAVAALIQHMAHAGSESLAVTLRYLPCFVGGALVSMHGSAITTWYAGLGKAGKGLLLCVGLVLYGGWLPVPLLESATIGALALLVIATSSPSAHRALNARWIQLVGARSYSLYLVHGVMLLALVNRLSAAVSFTTIALVAVPVIAAATEVSYRLVEGPSIRLSRWLGSRLQAAPATIRG